MIYLKMFFQVFFDAIKEIVLQKRQNVNVGTYDIEVWQTYRIFGLLIQDETSKVCFLPPWVQESSRR